MGRPWLFEIGAALYGIMTAQPTWESSCERLLAHFPDRNTSAPLRVLDLGCGPGVSTIVLARGKPHAVFIGLDLAPRMLHQAQIYTARAQLEGHISFVEADAANLPFATESIDMVTGHSFLYLVPDRRRVVEQAFRVLRRGGKLASMEPHGRVDWRALLGKWRQVRYLISVILWRPYSRLHGQFTDATFESLYRQAGLRNIRIEPVLDGFGIIGSGEKP